MYVCIHAPLEIPNRRRFRQAIDSDRCHLYEVVLGVLGRVVRDCEVRLAASDGGPVGNLSVVSVPVYFPGSILFLLANLSLYSSVCFIRLCKVSLHSFD